ncbi:MAG TPA: AmmeMemoRadiSam system radical SAM enzyme [Acidobacteriota bacterium]|nr:AmmeMemoRadiSam system radical SAM enzyme [Acidobacteriota bacterium]HNU02143.1 AmmeMemoRadiSam system radical SAM enzyme [Acidobacteriota bacterium]
MVEAQLYERRDAGAVRCLLCSHYCVIGEGRRGICGVRECRGGRLFTRVADRVVAIHVDPIEKKPLFHFLPGSRSLSVAAVGCNFRCEFCQNHSISQYPREAADIPGDPTTPDELVAAAVRHGCGSLSYTYTEPTVFFELTRATGLAARRAGLRNVYVTNGFMSGEAAAAMAEFLDAANVDLKSFSDAFYRSYCGARLQPVLDSIRRLHAAGVFLEVTTLIIPGRNSDAAELRAVAEFLAGVDPAIPWHVSAFHPDYRMLDAPPTPVALLELAYAEGCRAGLKYIYCGNVPGHELENTCCPTCRAVLIERIGFRIRRQRLTRPVCPDCGAPVPVVLATAGGDAERA